MGELDCFACRGEGGGLTRFLQEYYAALGRKGDKRPTSMIGKRLGA